MGRRLEVGILPFQLVSTMEFNVDDALLQMVGAIKG
jgi:hypothetical protein